MATTDMSQVIEREFNRFLDTDALITAAILALRDPELAPEARNECQALLEPGDENHH